MFNTKDIDENYELNTKDHLIIFMFTQTQRNEKRDNFDLMVADYDETLGKENSNYPSNTVHSEIFYEDDATINCGGSAKKLELISNVAGNVNDKNPCRVMIFYAEDLAVDCYNLE